MEDGAVRKTEEIRGREADSAATGLRPSASEAVLAAWTTLEVLTPQPLPDAEDLRAMRRRLVRLSEDPEPWNDPRNGRHSTERGVYWFIYLGQIDLAVATRSMLALFPDDHPEERVGARGKTTAAVVVLDAQGRPVPQKAFLSSFAWGYGCVRKRKLRELANFSAAESRIQSQIDERLVRYDTEGEIEPTSVEALQTLTHWLVEELHLPKEEVDFEGIAVRVPLFSHGSDAPEPDLLNSFLLDDLLRVRESLRSRQAGKALSQYLMMIAPAPRRDIVRELPLLQDSVSPRRLPLARWPVEGRHPLVLMQQAAVNHTVHELKEQGLVAINGPPGTGKTTLLRDIVTKVVLDRAIALSELPNPGDAFISAGSVQLGQSPVQLYRLHPSLLGHEIVVASSNNKAVENISGAIPGIDAIAEDLDPPLRYFASVSDCVASRGDPNIPEGSTWGLSAAVLGNSANRNAFAEAFWWDRQRGLGQYLLGLARGWNPTGRGEDAPAKVLILENAPQSAHECQQRWQSALKQFRAGLKRVRDLISQLSASEEALKRQRTVLVRLSQVQAETLRLEEAALTAQQRLTTTQASANSTKEEAREARADREALLALRPGWWARLFRTHRFRDWRARMGVAIERVEQALEQARQAGQAHSEAGSAAQTIQHNLQEARGLAQAAQRELDTANALLLCGRELAGPRFPDETFWNQDEDTLQTSSPWLGEALQAARDELFCAAFALHRAFIDVNARYLRQNLNAAMALLKGRSLLVQEEVTRSIWASLFLVVPVVSTTFASVGRLFGSLGQEQLGWLLIDEAGQATPQAAVGAIWRASRVVSIGDPLQIEPVVTTPTRLITAILSEFNLKADEWAAPVASVQVLADRVSWLGTLLQRIGGDIWVGSPLRVHRRCEKNPMFTVSNGIAYNNLMVYATAEKPSPIGKVLGESSWISLEGEVQGKWSETEGEAALQMLVFLLDAGIEEPDIFFISPFRAVATRLREKMRADSRVRRHYADRLGSWVSNRIGTVHTFQGKEAEAVVLVLGASAPEGAGARNWAGNPANLLNVAVTRAQRRLYVIGYRPLWRRAGVFRALHESLPEPLVQTDQD